MLPLSSVTSTSDIDRLTVGSGLWEAYISTVVLNDRLSLARPQLQTKCSIAAFLKLLLFREVGTAGFSCYNVMPFPENCCSTSLFTTGYKRLTEGGCELFWWRMYWRCFDGNFWLAAAATGCVSPPEQLSAPRTLYVGFRKAMLKKI
jgi:hypothetical protein